MPSYKLQVQDDDANTTIWHDVNADNGSPLLFASEAEARTRLEALFPVLVQLESFAAGPKRTRVIVANPYEDIDNEKDK
ncbi:MAG: hypothetical protein ABI583_05490 [Betaproteobacteria bacterium]